jgi:hypothetical protein
MTNNTTLSTLVATPSKGMATLPSKPHHSVRIQNSPVGHVADSQPAAQTQAPETCPYGPSPVIATAATQPPVKSTDVPQPADFPYERDLHLTRNTSNGEVEEITWSLRYLDQLGQGSFGTVHKVDFWNENSCRWELCALK